MWQKMCKTTGLLFCLVLGGVSAFANAAPVTISGDGSSTFTQVTLDGSGNGSLEFVLDPADQDAEVLSIQSYFNAGELDSVDVTSNGSSIIGGAISVDQSLTNLRISFDYVASSHNGTTMALVFTGTANRPIYVELAAVPLPAAAWMFLSMLFGGAWLKRRGSKRAGVLATA